jgi:16S rRNA (adenine1518-N6/adenine1519-N6)-dimethyltransferase
MTTIYILKMMNKKEFRIKNKELSDHFRPNKFLGQNFLIDKNIISKIVRSTPHVANETILEIGPGRGELTFELKKEFTHIVAVEKDSRLVRELKEKIAGTNIEIISGDILKMTSDFFLSIQPYRVVANIPYYLTSHLLRRLLEDMPQPQGIIVTIQKEVAERVIAKPPDMNLLALSVQMYAEPKILFPITKSAFNPIPKVDSACISITNISRKKFEENGIDEKLFFKMVRATFQGKRKVLPNTLSKVTGKPKSEIIEILKDCDISASARPETVTTEEWIKLVSAISQKS